MIFGALSVDSSSDSDMNEWDGGKPPRALRRAMPFYLSGGIFTNRWVRNSIALCLFTATVASVSALLIVNKFSPATKHMPLIFAAFSFGDSDPSLEPTNAALAWLVHAIAEGSGLCEHREIGCEFAPNFTHRSSEHSSFKFQPGIKGFTDTDLARIWQPMVSEWGSPAVETRQILVFGHGSIAANLRTHHNWKPPEFFDVSRQNGGNGEILPRVPEVDAFLEIRRQVAQSSRGNVNPDEMLEVVLVSHPHHIPYLVVIANAAGFVPLIVHSSLFDAVPWSFFKCGLLGYPLDMPAVSVLAGESRKLREFADSMNSNQAKLFDALLLKAAQAISGYLHCAAVQSASIHFHERTPSHHMIYNANFDAPPGPEGVSGSTGSEVNGVGPTSWMPVAEPASKPVYAVVERSTMGQSQLIELRSGFRATLGNFGLDTQGMFFEAGGAYQGTLVAAVNGSKAVSVGVSLSLFQNSSGFSNIHRMAEVWFTLDPSKPSQSGSGNSEFEWQHINFTLTSPANSTCSRFVNFAARYTCHMNCVCNGAFLISLYTPSAMIFVDSVEMHLQQGGSSAVQRCGP